MKKRINVEIILSIILAGGNNLQYVIERQIALIPSNLIEQINLLNREIREKGRIIFSKAVILGDMSPEIYITAVAADAIIFSDAITVNVERTLRGVQDVYETIEVQLRDVSSEIRKKLCVEILCSPNFKSQRVI